jgi:hypothetical protein
LTWLPSSTTTIRVRRTKEARSDQPKAQKKNKISDKMYKEKIRSATAPFYFAMAKPFL